MVVDTSAFVAILTGEPDSRQFIEAIELADSLIVSAATFVETSIVIETRYGPDGLRDFDLFLTKADAEIVAVDGDQAHAARRAFSRFGKGRHRAALNYGDCFSYALASIRNEPLLFKGDDFVHTDVVAAKLLVDTRTSNRIEGPDPQEQDEE
jgi:ribonuclease VapC